MLRIVCVCMVLVATAFGEDWGNEDEGMFDPDLFEGDILGIDPDLDRAAIPHKKHRWPDATIPYVIDESRMSIKKMILEAMDFYNETCIKFVERTTEKNYIRLFYGEGCNSHVGMDGTGEQIVNLGSTCAYPGVIAHELGHAVGFFHEQNRSDRDDYITIHWDNIKNGSESAFNKLKRNQHILFNDFDFDSIMMYGNFAASKNGKETMVAKTGRKIPGVRVKTALTESDKKRIAHLYCPKHQ